MTYFCRDCYVEAVSHPGQSCAACTQAAEDERVDDDERDECFHCGGEGYVECPDPLECTRQHIGGNYDGEVCPCGSCGGSGLAKDMTIW